MNLLTTPNVIEDLTEKAVDAVAAIARYEAFSASVKWRKIVEAVGVYQAGLDSLSNRRYWQVHNSGVQAQPGLGGRLMQARRAAHISQAEAGRHLGFKGDGVQISRWEKGPKTPDASRLTALAALYGVTEAWLLTGEEGTEVMGT